MSPDSLISNMLYIRADADSKIGVGHIMRCIALAQAWQDQGGEVTFISHCENEALRERIQSEGFRFIALNHVCHDSSDLKTTLAIVKKGISEKKTWLVLDGYHFTPDYQKAIRNERIHLLVIDDINHLPHYHANILLNQNIHAPDLKYHCDEDTILLLGIHYILLRKEFLKYRDFKRHITKRAKKILVTMGGADSGNVTLKVIEALKLLDLEDISVRIVIGPANPHQETLRKTLASAHFKAVLLVNPPDISVLMEWADMAISAAGSTCWELAFMGLPAILIATAENQREVSAGLEKAGTAQTLYWYNHINTDNISSYLRSLLMDTDRCRSMSAKGPDIVDGDGVGRVYAALNTSGLYLRQVKLSDCSMLWNWANDSVMRKMSVNKNPILLEEHIRWFKQKLSSDDTMILILEHYATPIGQIRFDINYTGEAEIDIFIAPTYRGQSLGTYLLKVGTKKYIDKNKKKERIKALVGYVRPENEPSRRVFERAGFRCEGSYIIQGLPLQRFSWPINNTTSATSPS